MPAFLLVCFFNGYQKYFTMAATKTLKKKTVPKNKNFVTRAEDSSKKRKSRGADEEME